MAVSDGAAYEVREHYTKYEYRVPMRDGVRLFTSVLVPKDASTTYFARVHADHLADLHPVVLFVRLFTCLAQDTGALILDQVELASECICRQACSIWEVHTSAVPTSLPYTMESPNAAMRRMPSGGI